MIKINAFTSKPLVDSAIMERLSFVLMSISEPVLLLLSGGSWLSLIPSFLEKSDVNLTVAMLDERFSFDETVNNYSQLLKSPLFDALQPFHPYVIATYPDETETIESFAKKYETALKDWRNANPDGKIIICQGIGPDCHTAGIMPFPENPSLFDRYFEENAWVCSYDATGKNPYAQRVTVTNTFLRIVDKSIMYLVGAEKQTAFVKMQLNEIDLPKYPCQIVQSMKDVEVFTNLSR